MAGGEEGGAVTELRGRLSPKGPEGVRGGKAQRPEPNPHPASHRQLTCPPVPLLPAPQKEVIQALPKLIKLNPIVVKEVFNRLLGTQHGRSRRLPPLGAPSLLRQEEGSRK